MPTGGWPTDAPLGYLTVLYDLETDPGETTNVASEYPNIVAIESAYADWNAQLPIPSKAILLGSVQFRLKLMDKAFS